MSDVTKQKSATPKVGGTRAVLWDTWKKGFFAWEDATAKYTEQLMKSPSLLGPSGMILGGAMRVKAAYDRAMSSAVGVLGLATKRDQERTLHALHQIESRMIDLEERLADLKHND